MNIAPSEKHLEDWIVNNWDRFGEWWLDEEDLPPFDLDVGDCFAPYFPELIAEQYKLPSGLIDLIGGDERTPQLCVIELKKGRITYTDIGQCARYLFDIGEILIFLQSLEKCKDQDAPGFFLPPFDSNVNASIGMQHTSVCGMVVGHGIQDENILLAAAQCNISVVKYDFRDTDGYVFETYDKVRYPLQWEHAKKNTEVTSFMIRMYNTHHKTHSSAWVKTQLEEDIERRNNN